MTNEKEIADRDKEINRLGVLCTQLEAEADFFRIRIRERDMKLEALENQVADAENRLRDFKNAVMLVVKELARAQSA